MTSNQVDETARKTSSLSSWGTWEELLLACAVKRHGLKNWDLVAMELQTKTSLPHLLTTAQFCKQKYMDLKRRFKDDDQQHEPDNNNNNIPWLEHLRKVRVDELKQDLQRYDLSIHCLQLKVKRLEEERDRCLDNNNTSTDPQPDLNQPNTSLKDNNKQPGQSDEPDKTCARLVSGEESDRDNRSVNESNSTGLSEKVGRRGGGELVRSEAEPGRPGLGEDGAGQGQGQRGTTKAEESEELGDSVTQLSSDVQSSASYGRKKRKLDSGGDAKSEPLIGLLDVIRTHRHASLFERRLKAQDSSKYKEIVRQHVDLVTIQTRIEEGIYSSSNLTFYRDLLLLFNNAIVFFPKSSLESSTAHELRRIVTTEINKETQTQKRDYSQEPTTQPKPQLVDKQKPSAPIIVCRKRSSISAKPSLTFAQKADQKQQSDDKKPATYDIKPSVERSSSLLKLKTQEKAAVITGTRSSRRNSNKNPTNTTNTPPPPPTPSSSNKKQSTGTASGSKAGSASVDKQETWETDHKKKTEASSSAAASDKKKSVVDFLKRIKKNSPVQTTKKNNNNNKAGVSEELKSSSSNNNNNNNSNSNNNVSSGKKDRKGKERQSSGERKLRKDTSPPKKNVGRPPKKAAAETTPVTGKRPREVVVVKRQSKRSRR
ncbi:hypothetical protein JRO89_XS05G0164600 [Xanthoceras sorbifolium]|uniref:Bromo domain-containing protein n=1 Tax=Xanthoceras sorbifolium TaxID=99658 RepID=A0ABQ8I253_9ROSI|nr:hypothetical protein JRO89_XS05G0164600 [Xanthoceras sorbifolium]